MAIVNIHRADENCLACQGINHAWPDGFDDILPRRGGGFNAWQFCQRCGRPRVIRFTAGKKRTGNIYYPNREEAEFYRHHTKNFSRFEAQSELFRRATR